MICQCVQCNHHDVCCVGVCVACLLMQHMFVLSTHLLMSLFCCVSLCCTVLFLDSDCTCRVWDIRRPDASLFTVLTTMGAVRVVRFAPDGTFWVHELELCAWYDYCAILSDCMFCFGVMSQLSVVFIFVVCSHSKPLKLHSPWYIHECV